MERVTLTIEGMSCGHCLNAVNGALRAVPGVTIDRVQMGSATVEFDPHVTDEQRIVDAVNDAGYTAYRASPA
ncbi:MAG TPA: heavy-metal-associated domain-containing protein [Gemmatimonadaceae bacterium]|nr:heavy-metal-associated domain-containing protein [Gemmatimonadaceae bacterium]